MREEEDFLEVEGGRGDPLEVEDGRGRLCCRGRKQEILQR